MVLCGGYLAPVVIAYLHKVSCTRRCVCLAIHLCACSVLPLVFHPVYNLLWVINCPKDHICLQPLAQPLKDKRHRVHINPVAGGETCENAHSSRYHTAGIYRWLHFLQLLRRWLLLWSCQLNDTFFRNRKHASDSFCPAFRRALPLVNAA